MNDLYTSVWVYLDIDHSDRVRQISDSLYHAINTDVYYQEDNPHITLHRGFQIPTRHLEHFVALVEDTPLAGRTVDVHGIKLWPSVNNPHVVMLDIDVDLSPTKSVLSETVEEYGGREFHDPVPPHITLFRTPRRVQMQGWDGLSDADEERFLTVQEAFQTQWKTSISDITLDLYDLPNPK